MVSKWMELGNLLDYLRTHPGSNRMHLIVQIARGLRYLHRLAIVHGDLKSMNILIDEDHKACISDFGLSRVTNSVDALMATSTDGNGGSMRWMAPELLRPELAFRTEARTTRESDVYALAMVMLEAFTGNIPFSNRRQDVMVIIDILSGVLPSRPDQRASSLGLSDDIWELMENCWKLDFRSRPRMSQVLKRLEKARREFVMPILTSPHPVLAPADDDTASDASTDLDL